jgi:Tol biopolymer transport system component
MRTVATVTAVLTVLTVGAASAQGPGGPGAPGAAPRKPLPLDAARKAEWTATRGTWISLDVSPDGQTIVFDLMGDLYTIPVAGGKATRLTSGMAYDAQPRYSPDGKKLVFVSDRSGGDNLWTLTLESKDTTQVTQGNGNLYVSPEWTPDGKYLVASRAGGLGGSHKIYMYPAEGGSGMQLTTQPAAMKFIGAAFTPDGRYMYLAARQGDWNYNSLMPQIQVGVYDRETGQLSQQVNRYGSAFRPAVSPDGKWLTYGSRHENKTGLRIRDLVTGDERWLLFPIQRDDVESRAPLDVLPGYSFTPDSRSVVISYGGEIWRIGVDGGSPSKIPFSADVKLDIGPEVKFVTRVDTTSAFTAKQIRNVAPSPDGKRIAFTAVDRLYIADLPEGKPRRVTTSEVGEYHAAWSPDGQTLAWVNWDMKAGGQIMKISPDAKNARPVQVTRVPALYYNVAFSRRETGSWRLARRRASSRRPPGPSSAPPEPISSGSPRPAVMSP